MDFIDPELLVSTNRGAIKSFPLRDGLSVAEFDHELHALLESLGVDVEIKESPYGVATTTPFKDHERASYDPDAVRASGGSWRWSDEVLEEFAGWYCGKASPVHLFWHGLDLAVTRFSGSRFPLLPEPIRSHARRTRTRSSPSVWAGDDKVREASYYSYTAPEPPDLRSQPLSPEDAYWTKPYSRCSHTRACVRRPTRAPTCSRSWRRVPRRRPETRTGTAMTWRQPRIPTRSSCASFGPDF